MSSARPRRLTALTATPSEAAGEGGGLVGLQEVGLVEDEEARDLGSRSSSFSMRSTASQLLSRGAGRPRPRRGAGGRRRPALRGWRGRRRRGPCGRSAMKPTVSVITTSPSRGKRRRRLVGSRVMKSWSADSTSLPVMRVQAACSCRRWCSRRSRARAPPPRGGAGGAGRAAATAPRPAFPAPGCGRGCAGGRPRPRSRPDRGRRCRRPGARGRRPSRSAAAAST